MITLYKIVIRNNEYFIFNKYNFTLFPQTTAIRKYYTLTSLIYIYKFIIVYHENKTKSLDFT